MKKKFLMLLCAICFMFPMALVGCDQTPPPTYYDVYFYNHDGVLISQKEVEDGKVAYCSTPTKSSDQYHIYEFDNWEYLDGSDATQDLTSVKNDMIVKATFNAIQPTYTVSFYDEDKQTVLDTAEVLRGESITFDTDQTKASDNLFDYAFSKWLDASGNEVTSINVATGDVSVYASWTQTRHSYTINVYNRTDKQTLLATFYKPIGYDLWASSIDDYLPENTTATCIKMYKEDDSVYPYYGDPVDKDLNVYVQYADNTVVKNGITYVLDQQSLSYYYSYGVKYGVQLVDSSAVVDGNIEIENTVDSINVTEIKEGAFKNFSDAITVKLPSNMYTIRSGAFQNCPKFTFDTSNNTTFTWLGDDKQCLIKDTTMYYANTWLESIPNTVTILDSYAFQGDLGVITIPTTVTEIRGNAFAYCTSLSEVVLTHSPGNIYGIYSLESEFDTKITINDANQRYAVIEWYDEDETTLLQRDIITKERRAIGGFLLTKDGNNIAGWQDAEGNDMSWEAGTTQTYAPYFVDITGSNLKLYAVWLPQITIGVVKYQYSLLDYGYVVNAINNTCTSVNIQAEVNGYDVVKIADNAFADNAALTSVNIPDSIKVIGNNAFKNCTAIQNISISQYVTTIAKNAFSGCTAKITIDNDNVAYKVVRAYEQDKTTFIKSVIFEYNTNFSITAAAKEGYTFLCWTDVSGNKITGRVTTNMDVYAKYVENTVVINGVTYKIKDSAVEYYVHTADANITSVVLETEIDGCVVTEIGDEAFKVHKNLVNITLPQKLKKIGNSVFNYVKFTSIVLPDTLIEIGHHAFYHCEQLESLVIPKSVHDIGESAFTACGITTLVLEGGRVYIDDFAFGHCDNLVKVIFGEELLYFTNGFSFYETKNVEIVVIDSAKIAESFTTLRNSIIPTIYIKTGLTVNQEIIDYYHNQTVITEGEYAGYTCYTNN